MNFVRRYMGITCILCGLHSIAVSANKPIPEGLQLRDGDTWVYRQVVEDANGQTRIFRPQFSVLYFDNNWTEAAITVMPGVEGHIAEPNRNYVREASYFVPALNNCFLSLLERSQVTQKQPCPASLPPGSSWTEQITTSPQITETRAFRILQREPIVTPAGAFQPMGLEIVTQLELPAIIDGTPEKDQPPKKLSWAKRVCTNWYDEKVKTFVKSTCEYFDAAGVFKSRITNELETYRVKYPGVTKPN